MKAFDIKVKGKTLDYRISKELNLKEVQKFFSKNYIVKKVWQESRHVLGILEKDGVDMFLKLATTEGISATTEIDYNWNQQANDSLSRNLDFWIPRNLGKGFYKENIFYIVTEYFQGELLAKRPHPNRKNEKFEKYIAQIIDFSEVVQNLDIDELSKKDTYEYKEWFLEKTKSWYNEVPEDIINKYQANKLLEIIEDGYKILDKKARHGDYTPWHMIKMQNGKIGLIDGEHAMKNSVEYYDIGYLIQRVFSVFEDHEFAKEILEMLISRNYDLKKLKVILASRAIGGFCDEVLLRTDHNFERANKFGQWVLSL